MIHQLKILCGLILVLLILGAVWIGGSLYMLRGLTSPAFTLVQQGKGFEVRDYPAYTTVETQIKGTSGEALISGRKLFESHIKNLNVPMSEPLFEVTVGDRGDTHLVSMIVPTGFAMKTTASSPLKVRNMQAAHVAVYTFTGRPTTERLTEEKTKFLRILTRDGVVRLSDFVVATYGPSYLVPFLIKNEMWVAI